MANPFRPGLRYLTDSGLETTLVFHDGRDLPAFAAYVLVDEDDGQARLATYYRQHAAIAAAYGLGFVFETPTWRASNGWGAAIGHSPAAIGRINRRAVAMMHELTREFPALPALVSGQVGPRGDGYVVGREMSVDEAAGYHARQIRALVAADLVTAMTMTYAAEAAGIARAAAYLGVPAVISFTVETDGRLPSGQPLGEAIEEVEAATDGSVLHYMVNCAHPEHFTHVLDGPFAARIGGIRANASCLSHAELDAAETLDEGDPHDLGRRYRELARQLPNLKVFGGCCGTDARHAGCIAAAIATPVPRCVPAAIAVEPPVAHMTRREPLVV